MSTVDDRVTALLASPSVPALIYALRHREVWPAGFEWDYNRCTKCAMGLAWRLWEEIGSFSAGAVAHAIKIPFSDAFPVFYGMEISSRGTITPEMVADELERLTAPAAP